MSVEALAEGADLPPAYVGLIEQAQESASNLSLDRSAIGLTILPDTQSNALYKAGPVV